MDQQKRATIADVAKLAGVSITTVSRVMNKNYPVKEATRKKVEKAIEELEFKPNLLARGLIHNKTQTIGILTPSIENLFFSEVVKGIDSVIKNKGYTTFLCNTEGDPEQEKLMIDNMKDRSVDGIIAINPRTKNIKSGYYEGISKQIPLVIINGYNRGIHCNYVLNDGEVGTYEALKYLYELGHRDIVFLRGRHSYSYDVKEDIYRKFCEEFKLEFDEDNILIIEDGNGLEAVEQSKVVVEKIIRENDKVSCLFACNDWMAVGALKAAKALSISVPEEFSIIGFDNTIISQITEPSLTTVDQNMSGLGQISGNRICEIIKDRDKENKKIIIETRLIHRNSVAGRL
ncbi:LacI family DNA-binding transcriptional regulator [Vallitalea guaymasensis]|uniref:LacI family DNA-binding transcriptional regulator n=1 Tax=Vallitalea guaymasensis TaxID=1185412 RepID=A0A8J8MAJ9_9FIRM|nr:LacI family DNA-binding transcriptional regulator [Vallitalea guaymasensis]QUH29160.1 LacI family DNA-binding transcriptional regulator [Vallitalea guaymasensis]